MKIQGWKSSRPHNKNSCFSVGEETGGGKSFVTHPSHIVHKQILPQKRGQKTKSTPPGVLLYSSFIRGENAPKGAGVVPALKAGVAGAVRVRILQGAKLTEHSKAGGGTVLGGFHAFTVAGTDIFGPNRCHHLLEQFPRGAGIACVQQGAQTVPHLKRHPGGIGNGIHHISAAETGRTVHSEAVIPAEADGILIGTGAETGITDALLQYRTVLSAESVVLSNQPTL